MNIFWKTFLLFCLLSSGFSVLQAAPDSVKITAYIFRWGENQKVLDQKNKFKATIYLTPEEFRRTLWSIPRMEKTTKIGTSRNIWRHLYEKVPALICNIDDVPFEFRRDEPRENKMAFRLERHLLPCRPGQTHRITDIPLDNGRKGQIDLVIRAPKTGIEQATIRKPMGPLTIADPIITSFRWGPHIDLQLDRDFFITRPDTTLKSLMDHYTYEDFEAMPIDPRIQLIEIPDTISKKVWDATPVDSRPKAYFTITEADYVNIGHSHLNAKGGSRGGGGSADHARSQAGERHSISLEYIRIDADSTPGTYLFYVQSARGVARKRVIVTE